MVAPLVCPVRLPSVEAAARFPDQSLDQVFVDGDHSEEACYADLVAWSAKLRPGGRLFGHDCTPGGSVARSVERFATERGRTHRVYAPPASHYIFEIDAPA